MSGDWKISGTYFEACNCDIACPCLFLGPPNDGECTALVGWHIDKGYDGDVSLEGLNVALAVWSPGPMLETQWKVALYLDDRASEAQQGALTRIFAGQAGGHPARLASHIGEVLGVQTVPIAFSAEEKICKLRIPDIAGTEIEAIAGQGEGPVKIDGHPLCIAPGHAATVAKSSGFRYSDHGLNWELSGKNGLFSPFSYQAD